MKLSKIFIPAKSPGDWKPLLADPEKHWRSGYSARTIAYCWQEAQGFPRSVQDVLGQYKPFKEIEILLAIPEHQVKLDSMVRPSQNDIWVLARCGKELVSIAVEGKVDEPFGPTMKEWGRSPGKEKRIKFLKSELGLSISIPDEVRYQLLHRTVSAILEAKRFNASHALMLVHSFSKEGLWYGDYARFISLFDAIAIPNQVAFGGTLKEGIHLHFAWVSGEPEYLQR